MKDLTGFHNSGLSFLVFLNAPNWCLKVKTSLFGLCFFVHLSYHVRI